MTERLTPLLTNGSDRVTPGILRPDENQFYLGGYSYGNGPSDGVLNHYVNHRPSNGSNSGNDHATLVGSPRSQTPFVETHEHFRNLRRSSSSSSSYTSQAIVKAAAVSAQDLIQCYISHDYNQEEKSIGLPLDDALSDIEVREAEVIHEGATAQHMRRSGWCLSPQTALTRHEDPYPCWNSTSNPPKLPPVSLLHKVDNTAQSHDFCWTEKEIYLLKLCKAFLAFGVQAHRLETYLHTTATFLKISAEFQQIPHCMLVAMDHPALTANHVHIVKESSSVDLGKLEDVYHVYEAVVKDGQDLRLSIRQLDGIIRRRRHYANCLLILLHGLAATCAGTFAFSARPVDFGPLFVFGSLLAVLQLLITQTPIRNCHLLEVLTCIIISFASRGLGTIHLAGDCPLFCFSGIAQGTIALILPGHIILTAIHEIQNRQILSGSTKMVYAILYTLFLGFGILIGATLFGLLDRQAVSSSSCELPWYWDPLTTHWRATYAQFVWVPLFALAISIMHQAKKHHLPAMVVIATCGHQVFYWSLWRFAQNLQFAGMLAAFTVGTLANLYAKVSGGLAATVLLPAALVIIPNALAASGGLVAGIGTANAIVTNQTRWIHGGFMTPGQYKRDFTATGPSGSTGVIVTAGFGMAQATIGITVGLFLSALLIWPFSRRKESILSF